MSEFLPELVTVLLTLLYLSGTLAAIEALLTARTPQGAIAWCLFLMLFPHSWAAHLLNSWRQEVLRLCQRATQ